MAKAISGSVGRGGKNRPEDVIVVQYLLNCVPSKQGGPTQELILDGLSGPKTCAAIQGFQSAALGFADSRVDPGGQTFTALLDYDPYPNQKLTLPASSAGAKGGKRGGTPSTNSWDPWGYNNPAGENYQKDGKQPGSKFGGDSSAKGASGKQSAGGKWGGKDPFGGKEGNQMAGGKWGGNTQSGIKGGSGMTNPQPPWMPGTKGVDTGGAGTKDVGSKSTVMISKDGGIVGKF